MTLAEYMKQFEQVETGRQLVSPIICRVDGKRFSRFTSSLNKPMDERLLWVMNELATEMVEHFTARVGFVQSDEISLLLYNLDKPESQLPYDGKVYKLIAELASFATVRFNDLLGKELVWKRLENPRFDARVFMLPVEHIKNYFLWRYRDGERNSIAAIAQAHYSHKQLHLKTTADMLDMLSRDGIDIHDWPINFRHGTFLRRIARSTPFTVSELSFLPEKHHARTNPDMLVERVLVENNSLTYDLVSNKFDFLVNGENALVENDPYGEYESDQG